MKWSIKNETLTFVAQLTLAFTAGIHYFHVVEDFFKLKNPWFNINLWSFVLLYCSKSWAVLSWNVTWRAPGVLNLLDLIRALLLFAIKDKLCNTQCQCFEWISCTQWLCLLMLPVMRYKSKLILSCLNGATGTRPKAYQESEPHVMQGLDACFGSKGQQSQCCSQSMCSAGTADKGTSGTVELQWFPRLPIPPVPWQCLKCCWKWSR